jgi:hypothetical protein
LEVEAEGGFKLDLRQDCDPGKQRLKGAVRTETYWHHYCQQYGKIRHCKMPILNVEMEYKAVRTLP